jgi:prolyl-tRNA synthetase
LRTERGVEVGNIFKLGTRFSDAFGATYLDPDGNAKPIVMGSYGIGVGRLLACVAEAHHDERGLRLPVAIAPYPVHLTVLRASDSSAGAAAERVYDSLEAAGIGVLFDDRGERPGVQFADADLIGLPVRLTVSERSLAAGGIELKRRDSQQARIVAEEALLGELRSELEACD